MREERRLSVFVESSRSTMSRGHSSGRGAGANTAGSNTATQPYAIDSTVACVASVSLNSVTFTRNARQK